METMIMRIMEVQTPAGALLLGGCGEELCLCEWAESPHADATVARVARRLGAQVVFAPSRVCGIAAEQLAEYFAGTRKSFDLPLLMAGTDFQKAVWTELLHIPYGTTITYGQEAQRLGRPAATRAVASPNGANPLCVIVPCHRVVGADGTLTGYSAGLSFKRYLLDLEGAGQN